MPQLDSCDGEGRESLGRGELCIQAADFRSVSYKFFWQRLIISSQDQNNAVAAQYIYLKISEGGCCPAMHEGQGPPNIAGATDVAEGQQLAQTEPTLL